MNSAVISNNETHILRTGSSIQSLNESYLTLNEELVIGLEWTEIYVIVIAIPFVLSLIINIILIASLIEATHKNHDMCLRRAPHMPVIDLILLILFVSTLFRLVFRTGLQVLCISGYCVIGIPLCLFHGFLNSLLYYIYLWTLALLVQDRYIKYRAQHDYTSKCSPLIVIVTIVGIIFVASVHVCGPIWGFSNYEFIEDEISCSVNWRSDYSCSYLIFSVLLISSPANLLTQMWTLMLIYKTVKRRYFTRADRRKSKESPQISVSLTSSLASSSIAALSRSFVLNESYEVLTVMLVSVTYTLTSLPKNLVDAAQACTASAPVVDPRLVFWTSVGREVGATFLIPLVLLLFHQRLRSSVRSLVRCSLIRLGLHRWLGDGGGGGHHQETIYLSTRPSTSIATTSNTAVTVI